MKRNSDFRIRSGKFFRHVIGATFFIFAFIFIAGKFLNSLDFLDPVGEALADFDFTDIAFIEFRDEPTDDERITLVNIGQLNRAGIARQLEIINKYDPKVIGVDIEFDGAKDSISDLMLKFAMAESENLVMISRLDYDSSSGIFNVITPPESFLEHGTLSYANLISPAGSQEQLKTCRSFSPAEPTTMDSMNAFSVALAMKYSPEKTSAFLERKNPYELINFRRNIFDPYGYSVFHGRYLSVDPFQILEENFEPEIIKDRIVILGYLGENILDPSWEDKYITPLNVNYAGRTNPDMFGAVIHANIISMILDEDYINEMGPAQSLIWAILLCLLNVACFMIVYYRLPDWYDGITKLIQLVEVIFLFFVIIYVFAVYNYKMHLELAIIAIALSGDMLEIYNGVIKNISTKIKRKIKPKLSWSE
ncbi:hypothetical protein DCC35_04005 [Mangrovivirga cuniculi]|uniref:CHASE2 domain-containing protein n=1 Tax=Mangrovivirga cuniculi TaxID=2715131 RepID=A0A4D7JZ67_9BACT|nr:hypothetical protein DCC35_04005 [Mangrovivirga cuniculi]